MFRKCHWHHFDFSNGRPENGAFEFDKEDDTVSVFWDKFIRAADVLPLWPTGVAQNGLLSLNVAKVSEGDLMDVVHSPDSMHHAHSSIRKVALPFNKVKARTLLKNAALILVVPPDLRPPP